MRERGTGYVYHPAGKRTWRAQYFHDGKRIREATGATTKEAAETWLTEKLASLKYGEVQPREEKATLKEITTLVVDSYRLRRNSSTSTLEYGLRHLLDYFGPRFKVLRIGPRIESYVEHRRAEGAAEATIRVELSHLIRGLNLAVTKKLISARSKPIIERPAVDPSAVRRGFVTRAEVDAVCTHLDADLADVVRFLFFSAWRVGEARTLQWKDYDRGEQTLRLRPEHSKTRHGRVLPLVGELAAVLERRLQARRLDCQFIFHRDGRPIGDFRKAWVTACTAVGLSGRIVHDLRRSGVKHLIEAGIDPHTAMAFSGHRTDAMLKRYHIIDVDDLRRAAERAYAHPGAPASVTRIATLQPPLGTTGTETAVRR